LGFSDAPLEAGQQLLPGSPASSPTMVGTSVAARAPLAESHARQRNPASSGVTEVSVATPVQTLPSGSARLSALTDRSGAGLLKVAGDSDLRPVQGAFTQAVKPLQVVDPADGLSAADAKPQPGSGSKHETPKLPPASAISRTIFSQQTSQPISSPAVIAMKPTQTIPDSGASATETPLRTRLQEHTTLKPDESSSHLSDADAQQASPGPGPVPLNGQAHGGDQPGNAGVTANVLAQVSPTASQAPGSRSAGSPVADHPSSSPEHQAPQPSSPTPLPAVGMVETARLVAGVAQSEMHIGLRTQAFGSVEVHTVLRDSQVGLTVGSERGDLRTLLAPELSGLQSVFRQQDLRFDNIRFLESNAGTMAGFSGGGDSRARSSSQQHFSSAGLFSGGTRQEDPPELDIIAELRARLNVHA
jgi:hypothetical protein